MKINTTQRDLTITALLADAETASQRLWEILPTLPHGVQASIEGDGYLVWSILEEEGLIGTASDIALKHGISIPGTWYMVGILDALPGPLPAPTIVPIQPWGTAAKENLGPAVKSFSIMARQLLGRPAEAFGMTSLIIFRKVSG